ncbi:NYN domain-containing protein [Leadbettera azotonutricia]|uniref:Conserved domain protein n=1 Tax=Leadbettera azotonutricia (strain ATCC BAA-888 / DSM 13862 / ZAS-9) TaxID=545695 RepID=F5YCH3_LEAAZ|nr:NYN domain-containing protein [Leadbettera azotonutricia]AEF82494.1 conserved domain protein [Leadbettera azotonutricia ZAS-9]
MPLLPFSNQAAEVSQAKLAVLIDADNTQPAIIEGLLDEVAKYGVASVKRIYGDWTSTNLRQWKERLLEYAIQPIQQFAYTQGKNATDSAMIIDAMDLLYSEKLDGFCIVSSDSDFTRLAARIRESGRTVYGFGEKKTPKAFVSVCDKFIYTEILRDTGEEQDEDEARPAAKTKKEIKKVDRKLLKLLQDVVDDLAEESGWAYLGGVGQKINNRSTDFDPRLYGFNKLGDMFRAIPQFETEERPQANGTGRQVYIRWKRKAR